HLRRVARPRTDLHDPGVAAGTILEERRNVGEQLVHHVPGAQERRRLPAGVQVAAPRERDHLLGVRPHRLRLGDRRLDPPVLDQRTGKVRVERLAVRRIAAELLPCASVTHQWSPPFPPPRRLSPCWASVSLTSSIDFLPKFGIAASSFSDFVTRSPIVSMPTRLRQLYERTPSSSSSIGKFSMPPARAGSACASAAAASPRPSIRSRSVKIASWRIRISAAWPIDSRGSIEPSVVTSIRSLS